MMQKSESISKLISALAVAQADFDPILKDKDNPFFHSKYADLASVIAATQPALLKNGLVVSQFPVAEDGRVGVLTILAHTSGEFIAESYALPIAKQDAQTGVGAVTYARRASYSGVIGVAAVDDDGNTAAGRNYDETPEETSRAKKSSREVSQAPAENHGTKAVSPEPEFEPVPSLPLDQTVTVVASGTPAEIEPQETPTFVMPSPGGVLPNEKGLEEYRAAIINLQKELVDYGGLKPSKGLTVSRKILLYLLKIAGVKDATQITITQWDALFSFINQLRKTEDGLNKLSGLINDAAKEASKGK